MSLWPLDLGVGLSPRGTRLRAPAHNMSYQQDHEAMVVSSMLTRRFRFVTVTRSR